MTLEKQFGLLAKTYCDKELELGVYGSGAGFYIGTFSDEGPCSRESNEYFRTREKAVAALANGEWTQKQYP